MTGTWGINRNGTLDAFCWCSAEIVQVSIFEVRNLLTKSCGSPECQRLGEEYLAERAA